MDNINKLGTEKLLMALDEEIEIKCEELKEKHEQIRLQKIFFLSCVIILAVFLLQAIFKLFNLNILLIIIIYQIIALIMFLPILANFIRGDITRWIS